VTSAEIEHDVLAEGHRLLRAAAEEGVRLRLLGGAAVRLRAPGELPSAFRRSYGDLDFVTGRGGSKAAGTFFREQGYDPHVSFNALNGRERLLFFDDANGRQVDVFVGSFRMSHEIPLDGRLDVDDVSIPLAELLLTKLQIHELNEKDVRDTLALLHDHEVGDADGDAVNAPQLARLCASDWGLWRTITANLDTCLAHVERYDVEPAKREEIEARLRELRERIDAEPKSRGWRLRAKIGERKRWYETPEEPGGE
jgi:hypothetical protein